MNAILTGYSGDFFEKMSAITAPLMLDYASRCGADFEVVSLAGWRPASWMKIPAICKMLEKHQRVLWLDADVVIQHSDANLFELVPAGFHQALVEHVTPSGRVPNCGVWLVDRSALPVIEAAWMNDYDGSHPWWEQSAILRAMGYGVEREPRAWLEAPTDFYRKTFFLPPEWNDHPHDARRVVIPRFRHVTQYGDRLDVARLFASESRTGAPVRTQAL